jgi:hypothetical protein
MYFSNVAILVSAIFTLSSYASPIAAPGGASLDIGKRDPLASFQGLSQIPSITFSLVMLTATQTVFERDPIRRVPGKREAEPEPIRRVPGKREAEPEPIRRVPGKREAEPEPIRRVAGKREAEAEPEPIRRVPGKREAEAEPEPIRRVPGKR